MQTWYDPFQYFNICAIIRCPFRIWLLSEVCLNPHVYLFPFRHFPFRSQGTQINHLVSSSFFFLTQLSHDIRFKFFVSALSDIRPCSECSQLMQWKRNSLFPMFFLLFFLPYHSVRLSCDRPCHSHVFIVPGGVSASISMRQTQPILWPHPYWQYKH